MLPDPHAVRSFQPSRRVPALRLVLASALLIASVAAILTTSSTLVTVLGIVVAVLALIAVLAFAAALTMTRRPVLVLRPSGLRSRGFPEVAWPEVAEMRAVGVNARPALLIKLRDDEAFLARTTGP